MVHISSSLAALFIAAADTSSISLHMGDGQPGKDAALVNNLAVPVQQSGALNRKLFKPASSPL